MNITIPSNATTPSIQTAHVPPKGATHFRFTTPRRKPVIDKLKNLDTLAGCHGKLEYGTVEFEGRGRHAKIKAFTVIGTPVEPQPKAISAAPKAVEPKNSKGRKNKILGFSACAVAKAFGKAGVKWEEADRIFRAHGIAMSKASLSVQLGFGRNPESWKKHGQPAPLTGEQIGELRDKHGR